MKFLLAILLLALFQLPATAAEVTWVWEPPAFDPDSTEIDAPTEPVGYRARYMSGNGDWIDWPTVLPEATLTLDQVPNIPYRVQVAALDSEEHQGVWSEVSDPGKYGAPGACGRPRVVTQ